ncbi:MAG: ComEC/Rec2 family competence protein, partial [Myxococcaceae bacterium]
MDRLTWGDLLSRPVFLPALCVAVGAAIGPITGHVGSEFLLIALLLGMVAMRLRGRAGGLLAVLAAGLLLGAGLMRLQLRTSDAAPEGPVAVEAELERVDRTDEGGLAVTAKLIQMNGQAADVRAVLFSQPTPLELFEGQRVRLIARLKTLHGPDNPGEPDFAEPRWRAGIAYSGTFDPARVAALTPPPKVSLWMTREHEALSAATRLRAPDDESAALYLTLAAGARASLPDSIEDAFARSGLVHVLSVSGLHVAALALMLLKILRLMVTLVWRRARTTDARRIAAPLSIPFVWAYVAYTGWQGPAVRSAVMASVVLLGLALWRRSDSLSSLSIAALLVVCIWPAAVVDLSLQLSFLAICSLLIVAPAFRDAVPIDRPEPSPDRTLRYRFRKLAEIGVQTACASAAVVIASIPLVSTAFGRMSLAGIVSNVVCLPLCGAITALAAGGAASFAVHPVLASPWLWAGTRASWLLVHAAEFFARMPGASIELPAIRGALAAMFFAGLFAFALCSGRWRWLGVAAPIAVLWALLAPVVVRPQALDVTFLAVGQGDAIVVSSAGHHALIDGG